VVDLDALDQRIAERAEAAFTFLERLVAAPSVVGGEQEAQEVVAAELERLRFAVERLQVPETIATDPAAGVPQQAYAGRYDLVARRGSAGAELQLGGHVDVVPADEPILWAADPFAPVRKDGWLHGRGAGDMKGGFAMGVLALDALDAVAPELVDQRLSFVSAIEEECTGNGTLALLRAGAVPAAAVLLEPTGLELLLGGVGVMWFEIAVAGHAAHAESADRAVNAVDPALTLLEALRELEAELNADVDDPLLRDITHPYNLNVGTFRAGDWPSSVPGIARLGVRLAYPRAWTPDQAEQRLRSAVAAAAAADPWLAEHPPAVRCTGFRAEGYALGTDDPLAVAVAEAHERAHGTRPRALVLASTTDARFYLNQFGVPCLCYGPRVRNIHGIDESVELASVVDGARTLARLVAAWAERHAPGAGDGA
jgi:acetylornithine deacetylase